MTLWFVGMGVSGVSSIPSRALQVLRDADAIYLEEFTSPVGRNEEEELDRIAPGRIHMAKRWQVEDGREILESANTGSTVLLSYGDPYIATTHMELRTRAIGQNIETRAIHAASALTSMVGECGLHYYKIGRTATIMNDAKSVSTPYRTIYRNLMDGIHTVLLLEYDQDGGFFLGPGAALDMLLAAEEAQGRGVFSKSTFVIIASRIGSETQSITAGSAAGLRIRDFGGPPHSIIIPGRMHFTESDALRSVARCIDGPHDNSDDTAGIPAQMIKKYVPMVMDAIREVSPLCAGPGEARILENARLYARDAEDFLEKGEDEVAVLCIGYADGLVDALRMARGLEPRDVRN